MEKIIKKKLKDKTFTWLITGSSGFIGGSLVKRLVQLNQKVIGIDIKKTSYVNKNYLFIQDDLKNIDAIKKKIKKKIDYIFHQASLTSVSESIEKPNLYLSDNFLNFKNILILSEYKKIKNLVFASSSAVYGNRSNINFEKNSISFHNLQKLTSPYAQSKKIIEEYAKVYQGNFNIVGLRYFNVFGPQQRTTGKNLPVISNWINLLKNKKILTIYGDGKAKRDFIYIDDVVNANIISALIIKQNEILNICSSKSITMNKLYAILSKIHCNFYPHFNKKPSYSKIRMGDIKKSIGSNNKAKKTILFKENLNFINALTATYKWQIKKN